MEDCEQPTSLWRTALVRQLDNHPDLGRVAGHCPARPPSPSLRVTGLIVRVRLAGLDFTLFFTKLWLKQRQPPPSTVALAAFSGSVGRFTPSACSTCVSFLAGKMGCSALKTDRVRSSLAITSPALGPVWITLALSSWMQRVPFAPSSKERGVSSTHLRHLCCPVPLSEGVSEAYGHTRCPSRYGSARSGCGAVPRTPICSRWQGVKSLVFGWWGGARVSRDGAGRNVRATRVRCPPRFMP